jgi:hypothetical protein
MAQPHAAAGRCVGHALPPWQEDKIKRERTMHAARSLTLVPVDTVMTASSSLLGKTVETLSLSVSLSLS